MVRQLAITELILAAVLCIFAVGTVRAADSERKHEYKEAIERADADYKAAKEACESREGHERDVCMKQARADHVRATAEAKAQYKSKTAMAGARESDHDAQYKVAKEKCEGLSGDAQEACIRDAKMRYHQ